MSIQHPNRPHTSHEQDQEKLQKNRQGDPHSQHKNPTHQTDIAAQVEHMPESDIKEDRRDALKEKDRIAALQDKKNTKAKEEE